MLRVKEYMDLYGGVSKHTIHAHKRYGHPCIKKIGHDLWIDVECLNKKRQFFDYVYDTCSNNYYKLLETYSESEIAKLFAAITGTKPRVWYNVMQHSLFTMGKRDMSEFVYKIPKRVYDFLLVSNYALSGEDMSVYDIGGDVNG